MNKCILISGGGSGLGLALVKTLLTRGHRVATFTRTRNAELCQLKEFHPESLMIAEFDISDISALKHFVREVRSQFSTIDVLINNVGYLFEGILAFTSDYEIEKTIAINITSPFILIREVANIMMLKKTGVIINISSINSVKGHKGVSLYSLSKAAIDGVTRSLAKELGPLNITVNSIVPGFFDSQLVSSLDKVRRDGILKRTALPRLGTADDIAKVVMFMISEDASFITGQSIIVDGGITC